MPRLVALAGPSCVGKSPLAHSLARLAPDLARTLVSPVLYNSRAARPGEQDGVDYHFRSREYLEGLRGQDGYLVLDVRRDIHALAWADLQAVLGSGRDAFFEGNPYVATAMMQGARAHGAEVVSVFLAPLSGEEIGALREAGADMERTVAGVMRRKLLRRATRHKGELRVDDLQDIEARCGAAWRELQYAPQFQWVLPNHDGEDSENWEAFPVPLGDARLCGRDFVTLLRGGEPARGEHWDDALLSG
jgi:guanylate kinase